jgi:CIC family chloride channel protein
MERRIETLPGTVEREHINQALVNVPRWIIITEGNDAVSAMPAVDLARYLFEHQDEESINLGDIPAERREIAAIDFQATLQEALTLLNTSGADALYVVRRTIPGLSRIYGIITRGDINRSYNLE